MNKLTETEDSLEVNCELTSSLCYDCNAFRTELGVSNNFDSNAFIFPENFTHGYQNCIYQFP